MKWTEAVKAIERCEAELRDLMGQAAAERDYASVLRIAEWARALAAMAAEGTGAALARSPAADRPANPSPQFGASGARRAPGAYPRFYRRDDELVKVGWSKKDRREYHHRAARRAVDVVAAAVRQLGARGGMFTGDKLLPLKDPADGSRIADYQVYVALAWLRHLGIVRQHGRKSGYSLVADKPIDSILTDAWAKLEEWRG